MTTRKTTYRVIRADLNTTTRKIEDVVELRKFASARGALAYLESIAPEGGQSAGAVELFDVTDARHRPVDIDGHPVAEPYRVGHYQPNVMGHGDD